MPKKRILFGIGVGVLFSCITLFFVYSDYLDGVEASQQLTDEDVVARAESLGMAFTTQGHYNEPETSDVEDTSTNYSESEELTSEELTPEELTSEELTSGELTSEELTSEELTSEELTSGELTTEELTSEELTTEELTSGELTSEELTSEEAVSNVLGTDETYDPIEPTNMEISSAAEPELSTTETITETTTAAATAQIEQIRVVIKKGLRASEICDILQEAGVIESADDLLAVLRDKDYTMRISAGPFNLTPGMAYEELADELVR